MQRFYSRVPAAAVRQYWDGNLYVYIPHRLHDCRVIEDFGNPRLMRFSEGESFIRNGEAFIYFGALGDALPLPVNLPFGVTVERGAL